MSPRNSETRSSSSSAIFSHSFGPCTLEVGLRNWRMGCLFGIWVLSDGKVVQIPILHRGPHERRKQFLERSITGTIEALTESEGRTILGQPSLNTLRNRILAEAREAGIDLRAWKVRRSLREVTTFEQGISSSVPILFVPLAPTFTGRGFFSKVAPG